MLQQVLEFGILEEIPELVLEIVLIGQHTVGCNVMKSLVVIHSSSGGIKIIIVSPRYAIPAQMVVPSASRIASQPLR